MVKGKRRKLIYNLGRRGFFSEINNMIIAKIFAEEHHWDFEVNSFYWNCRYKKGLRDYFYIELQEYNNIFSAQMVRGKNVAWNLHALFYLGVTTLNNIYKFFNSNIILGSDVYQSFRALPYLNQIDVTRFQNEMKRVLRLNDSLEYLFINQFNLLGMHRSFLGVHIRRGDKITTGEMQNIPLSQYIEAIKQSQYKDIYIATDDYTSIDFIKRQLQSSDFQIYCNPLLSISSGFSEGKFNRSSKENRYKETCSLLFDIFVLCKASFFIGTYSSNLSRVIPCVLGLKNCKSLDIDWFVG